MDRKVKQIHVGGATRWDVWDQTPGATGIGRDTAGGAAERAGGRRRRRRAEKEGTEQQSGLAHR